MITESDVSITHHPTDGFTLSTIANGYYEQRRYIFYSVNEAMRMFLTEMNGDNHE